MRPKRELDARTLRVVARRLVTRAKVLRAKDSPSDQSLYWLGGYEALEYLAQLWANEARAIEALTKKPRKAK